MSVNCLLTQGADIPPRRLNEKTNFDTHGDNKDGGWAAGKRIKKFFGKVKYAPSDSVILSCSDGEIAFTNIPVAASPARHQKKGLVMQWAEFKK